MTKETGLTMVLKWTLGHKKNPCLGLLLFPPNDILTCPIYFIFFMKMHMRFSYIKIWNDFSLIRIL